MCFFFVVKPLKVIISDFDMKFKRFGISLKQVRSWRRKRGMGRCLKGRMPLPYK
jgi:hypothetical protein